MSSFGVMCKATGHSFQNCLLSYPAKCQGRATPWIGVISNFQWLLKMGNCLFILTVCDVFMRSRRFEKAFCQAGEADIQDCEPGFFWTLLIIIAVGFRLGTDYGLFVVNLVNLESVNVLFRCITHCTNYIMYLAAIQT